LRRAQTVVYPVAVKITYVTLAGNEDAHQAYEAAIAEVRGSLGATHDNHVAGRSLGWTGPLLEDRSPVDPGQVVGRFPAAGPEVVGQALDAARRAYPAWSATPWRERLAALRLAAERLSQRVPELAALLAVEVGKSRLEAMGDAEEAADLIRYYCSQVEEADGFSRPLGRLLPGEETLSILRPYGVWGVVSPFNFPLALPAGMAAGALAAGNTVVLKPASEAALAGLRLYEVLASALAEAGAPPGVVNFVTGSGDRLGPAFLDAGFDGLVFTGSKRVGFELLQRFWRDYPKPVVVEMGGKNPAIVTARADLDKAAQGIARSAFGYGGQKCSACSRALVAAPVYDEFLARLERQARGLKIGDPAARDTYLGPLIDEAALSTYRAALAEARRDGRVVVGGEPPPPGLPPGHFATPAIVDRLSDGHRLLREELFVPLVAVVRVASLAEAIARANQTEYGLTAGIFSEDEAEVEAFFAGVEAGVLYANRATGATTGAWPGVQSFCGWKASGSTGKGACGPYYVQQFLREQSRTHVRP
jgi:1-pyrroline-5-carboxylate dehydrogenase